MIVSKKVTHARVRVSPIYRCCGCGKDQEGYACEREIKIAFGENLLTAVDKGFENIGNAHMPLGWASFAGGKHLCKSCSN